MAELVGKIGKGIEEGGVRGPGLVEVDGDGEGVHLRKNEVIPTEAEIMSNNR